MKEMKNVPNIYNINIYSHDPVVPETFKSNRKGLTELGTSTFIF
jgi:hypothetical protein